MGHHRPRRLLPTPRLPKAAPISPSVTGTPGATYLLDMPWARDWSRREHHAVCRALQWFYKLLPVSLLHRTSARPTSPYRRLACELDFRQRAPKMSFAAECRCRRRRAWRVGAKIRISSEESAGGVTICNSDLAHA